MVGIYCANYCATDDEYEDFCQDFYLSISSSGSSVRQYSS